MYTVTDKSPKYVHDCSKCTYLGHIDTKSTYGDLDLYHCQQGGFGSTVIARYADEGGSYMSGLSPAQYIVQQYLYNNKKTKDIEDKDVLEALDYTINTSKHMTSMLICMASKISMERGLLKASDFL